MSTMKSLEQLRRHWDRQSRRHDKSMTFLERKFFDDTRPWIGNRTRGRTLEVAIGTGLSLAHYPRDIELVGVELSPRMLDQARDRAEQHPGSVELRLGDAQNLEFDAASFDTVVCMFSLCSVPDDREAVAEMVRVLRPGGLLLLADHVVSTSAWIRVMQRVIELGSIRYGGEHYRRRPIRHVEAAGLRIEEHDRFKRGVIERLAARKPDSR